MEYRGNSPGKSHRGSVALLLLISSLLLVNLDGRREHQVEHQLWQDR